MSSRKEILSKYELSKERDQSRPIRVEHGTAGEAAIREWLKSSCQPKYDVTSGYIIPDLIVDSYTLYHYDVMIFDRIDFLVLWVDSNDDRSKSGERRAIPAKYVLAVFEVKASLTKSSARDSIKKLSELNGFIAFLPKSFFCMVLFFELPRGQLRCSDILYEMLPVYGIFGYSGGTVLKCDLNSDVTGIIRILEFKSDDQRDRKEESHPLAKDVDTVEVFLDQNKGCVTLPPGECAEFFLHESTYHLRRRHPGVRISLRGFW